MTEGQLLHILKEVYGTHTQWSGVQFQRAQLLVKRIEEVERAAVADMVEKMGMEGYGTLAIATAIRARSQANEVSAV